VTLRSGFPRRTLKATREIYRIHRTDGHPWWFSTDGSGHFDPLGTGFGACYLAERPLGAWVEGFRKAMLLAEAEVQNRALFAVALGRDLKLADLTSRRALQFGVTASVGANEDYTASQALASDAVESGFAGVRYLVRHDPAQPLYGIALFSEAGTTLGTPSLPMGSDMPIPQQLVADAARLFSYRVLPTP
jgi:RES domain